MFESICDLGFEDCAKYSINDVRHPCYILIKKPIKKHAKLETTSKTTTKLCHTSRTKLVDHVPITNNQKIQGFPYTWNEQYAFCEHGGHIYYEDMPNKVT